VPEDPGEVDQPQTGIGEAAGLVQVPTTAAVVTAVRRNLRRLSQPTLPEPAAS
jgi:hypothetical protein